MKKWSNEMIEKTLSLLKDGKSYSEIGDCIGKNSHSVKCKILKMGFKSSDYIKSEKYKEKKCLNCGKIIYGYKKFCNHSCSASFTNNLIRDSKIRKKCLNCNEDISNKNKFCNNVCQRDYYRKMFIEKWKNGEDIETTSGKMNELSKYIRNYIIEKYNYKCAKCGWNEINIYTNKVPLQVDHIDGNHMNNTEENLIPLCPNCHSLTSTYGSRNIGNGRLYRREMRKNGKCI